MALGLCERLHASVRAHCWGGTNRWETDVTNLHTLLQCVPLKLPSAQQFKIVVMVSFGTLSQKGFLYAACFPCAWICDVVAYFSHSPSLVGHVTI